MRVLDIAAGNGVSGEALAAAGLHPVLGTDIVPSAREAALRDRPGLYDQYLTLDLLALSDAQRAQVTALRANALSCVAPVGANGSELPVQALVAAAGLLAPDALVVYMHDPNRGVPDAITAEVWAAGLGRMGTGSRPMSSSAGATSTAIRSMGRRLRSTASSGGYGEPAERPQVHPTGRARLRPSSCVGRPGRGGPKPRPRRVYIHGPRGIGPRRPPPSTIMTTISTIQMIAAAIIMASVTATTGMANRISMGLARTVASAQPVGRAARRRATWRGRGPGRSETVCSRSP